MLMEEIFLLEREIVEKVFLGRNILKKKNRNKSEK